MERETHAGKTFRAEQVMNGGGDPEEIQESRAAFPGDIGGEGAVAGEYLFQNRHIRTLTVLGTTWFWASDVCNALEMKNSRRALARLEVEEKGVTTSYTLGGPQTVNVVNESGLYALVMTSRKKQARAFRRWVTGEVLPAIRKTGVYSRDGSSPQHSDAIVLPSPDYPTRYVVLACPGRPAQIRRTQ